MMTIFHHGVQVGEKLVYRTHKANFDAQSSDMISAVEIRESGMITIFHHGVLVGEKLVHRKHKQSEL